MPTDNQELNTVIQYLIEIKESQATSIAHGEACHDSLAELSKKVGIQNGRIWKLEAKYNYFIGAMSIVGIVGGIVWKLL